LKYLELQHVKIAKRTVDADLLEMFGTVI